MAIHQWPVVAQPREKLMRKGAQSLSDAELLAIFLRTGIPGSSAVELAQLILQTFGGFKALLGASLDDFSQIKGIGQAKYVQLQAVLEMSRRYFSEEMHDIDCMGSPDKAKNYVLMQMRKVEREVFSCLFLNTQNHLIQYQEVFQGTLDRAPVFPREIARLALEYNAAAIILVHNHPSGSSKPSASDQQVTDDICDVMALVDIKVLDHFIVGGSEVFSFAEHGLL